MNVSKFAIKRSVFTIMLIVTMVVAGIVIMREMSSQLLPNFNIPIAIVRTNWSGATPDNVEKLVTSTIEDALTGIEGIKNVSTYSRQDTSIVVIEFDYGMDVDDKLPDIRSKIDNVAEDLPDDASTPLVLKIDINAKPIIVYNIFGDDLINLYSIADDTIAPTLEKISGVSSVDISGGLETEVRVAIDEQKIKNFGLDINTIISKINSSNINIPLGNIAEGYKKFILKATTEVESLDEAKNIIISNENGIIVRLKDVADVSLETKDIESYARQNSKEAVRLEINKMDGANTVEIIKNVKETMKSLMESQPDNIQAKITSDDSTSIKQSIGTVTQNAIQGLVLAGIVLLIFLKNIRASLIVAISIPVSIIFTFALFPLLDININMMSLMGLALGIGMLVDNSVVVIDNIFRHITELKQDKITASSNGASEMSFSLVASTATTVAVFIPIILKPGMTREVFNNMSFAIAFALISSLLIALTFVPMAASKLLNPKKVSLKEGKVLNFLKKYYIKFLNVTLNHRIKTVFLTILIFVAVVFAGKKYIQTSFFPTMDEGKYNIAGTMAKGLELEKANEIAKIVEKVVKENKFTKDYSVSVTETKVNLDVQALKKSERKETIKDIMAQVRDKIKDIPDVNFIVSNSGGGPGGGSSGELELNLMSSDREILEQFSVKALEKIKTLDGIVDENSSFEGGNPQIKFDLNREKMAYYGIDVSSLASYIYTKVYGKEIFTIKTGEQEIDVTLRAQKYDRDAIEKIKNLEFKGNKGNFKLKELANITLVEGSTEIDKKNRKEIITIGANLEGIALNQGVERVENALKEMGIPKNITYTFGGNQESLQEIIKSIIFALKVSVYAIFFILAAQFESFTMPLIIMGSLPLSIIGVVIGIIITGIKMDMMVMVGIVMLMGIVVNNAIVLVDYINLLRAKGKSLYDAIIEAGQTRLRPILMTTMTTVLGMIPLALGTGEGSEFYKGLAISVISGLSVSTLLTLIFIPVLYSLEESIRNKFRRKLKYEATVLEEKEGDLDV